MQIFGGSSTFFFLQIHLIYFGLFSEDLLPKAICLFQYGIVPSGSAPSRFSTANFRGNNKSFADKDGCLFCAINRGRLAGL